MELGLVDDKRHTDWIKRVPRKPVRGKAFDPDQPRDEHGRWTDGGGGEVYDGTVSPKTGERYDFLKIYPTIYREKGPGIKISPEQERKADIMSGELGMRSGTDNEMGHVVGPDGQLFTSREGSRTSISWPNEDIRQMAGMTMIHSHPNEAGAEIGFSKQDVFAAASANLAEMRAVTPDTTYIIRPTHGDGEPDWDWGAIALAHDDVRLAVQESVIQDFEINRIDPSWTCKDECAAAYYDRLWTAISAKAGLEYEKIPTPEPVGEKAAQLKPKRNAPREGDTVLDDSHLEGITQQDMDEEWATRTKSVLDVLRGKAFDPDQPRDEHGRWSSDGESEMNVSVPASVGISGEEQGINLRVTTASGVPVRGVTIAWDDPRIPETLYHVSPDAPAVAASGVLLAGGVGGLGGDRRDEVVSMSVSREKAESIRDDMKLSIEVAKLNGDDAAINARLMQEAQREGWADTFREIQRGPEAQYEATDHLRQFFIYRENEVPERPNPLLFSTVADLAQHDARNVGIVEIPKENLNNGALITDFDAFHGTWGANDPNISRRSLGEIRSYGDVKIGNVEVKAFNEDQPRDERGRWTSGGGDDVVIGSTIERIYGEAYGRHADRNVRPRAARGDDARALQREIDKAFKETVGRDIKPSERIDVVSSLIAGRATEHGFVLDREGNIVSYHTDDQAGQITFEESDLNPGELLVHNHPSGGAFSSTDISSAVKNGLAEIRAVGERYTYIARPDPGTEWNQADAARNWSEILEPYGVAERAAKTELLPQVTSGTITPEQADILHRDRVWREVGRNSARIDVERIDTRHYGIPDGEVIPRYEREKIIGSAVTDADREAERMALKAGTTTIDRDLVPIYGADGSANMPSFDDANAIIAEKAFNEDQPRDERGRWTSDGDEGSASAQLTIGTPMPGDGLSLRTAFEAVPTTNPAPNPLKEPGLRQNIRQAIAILSQRGEQIEQGILLDKDGNIVVDKDGREPTPEERAQGVLGLVQYSQAEGDAAKGGVDLHSHPNPAGQSIPDVMIAAASQVQASIVVHGDDAWMIRPRYLDADGNPDWRIKDLANDGPVAEIQVRVELLAKYPELAQGEEVEGVDRLFTEMLWETIEDRGYLIHEKVRVPTEEAALRPQPLVGAKGRGTTVKYWALWADPNDVLADYERLLREMGLRTKEFDPDQPRDELGRWTSEGDGGTADGRAADGRAGLEPGSGAPKGPFREVASAHEALEAIARGEYVSLPPDQLGVLLDQMYAHAQEAERRGLEAPTYDLCQVSVPDTNIFCEEALDVPRVEMPQIANVSEFKEHLRSLGYGMVQDSVPADRLKATQNELDGVKVGSIMAATREGKFSRAAEPMFVSSDNFVLDGHHRWAAAVGLDYDEDAKGGGVNMDVIKVDLPITALLPLANEWFDQTGAQREGFGAKVLRWLRGAVRFKWSEEDHPRDESGRFTSDGDGGSGEWEKSPIGVMAAALERSHPTHFKTEIPEGESFLLPSGKFYNIETSPPIHRPTFVSSALHAPHEVLASNLGYEPDAETGRVDDSAIKDGLVRVQTSRFSLSEADDWAMSKGPRPSINIESATVEGALRVLHPLNVPEHIRGDTVVYVDVKDVLHDGKPIAQMRDELARLAGRKSLDFDEEKHPRDASGRFTDVSGGELDISGGAAGRLAKSLREHGGFTYSPLNMDAPTTGKVLSIDPERVRVIERGVPVTPDDLQAFAEANRDLLADSSKHIGGWKDSTDGTVYLDVSTIVETDEEARALAQEHKQLAYFDLATGQEVRLDGKAGLFDSARESIARGLRAIRGLAQRGPPRSARAYDEGRAAVLELRAKDSPRAIIDDGLFWADLRKYATKRMLPVFEELYKGGMLAAFNIAQRTRPKRIQRKEANIGGVMVALYPPPRLAREIAIDDGEEPDQLHITLAYLGKTTDDVEDPQAIIDAIAEWAAEQPAFDAELSGVGRFTIEGEEDAFYASVDAPALPDFRQGLVETIEAAGGTVSKLHGFTPHMTLAYVPEDEPSPIDRIDKAPMHFGSVAFVYGGDRTDIPLGRTSAKAETDIADFLRDNPRLAQALIERAAIDARRAVNEWWEQLEATTKAHLANAIDEQLELGVDVGAVVEAIEPLFGDMRAQRIAVTETTRAMGQAALATYEELGVEEWEWRTAEDPLVDRDCEERAEDGPYPIYIDFEPAHPNCRCWPVPIMSGVREWSEEDHPRDNAGRFSTSDGGGGGTVERVERLYSGSGVTQEVTLYHGTRNPDFDPKDLSEQAAEYQYGGSMGPGVYMGEDRETAEYYGDRIIEATVQVQNPLVFDLAYEEGARIAPEIADDYRDTGTYESILVGERVPPFDVKIGEEWYEVRSAFDLEHLGREAEAAGHDAVVARNMREGSSAGASEVLLLNRSAIVDAAEKEWDEEKHPRDATGKFTAGGGLEDWPTLVELTADRQSWEGDVRLGTETAMSIFESRYGVPPTARQVQEMRNVLVNTINMRVQANVGLSHDERVHAVDVVGRHYELGETPIPRIPEESTQGELFPEPPPTTGEQGQLFNTDAYIVGQPPDPFVAEHFKGDVTVNVDAPDVINDIERSLFGREIEDKEWAQLIGAPDGAEVKVAPVGEYGDMANVVHVSSQQDEYRVIQSRYIGQDDEGETVIQNASMTISQDAPAGLGTHIIAMEVEKGKDLGVDRIEVYAAGFPGSAATNGYYTWPRMGFDAPIPSEFRTYLPAELTEATRMNEVMAHPDGRAAWKAQGRGIDLVMDLSEGSKSLATFEAYLEEKGYTAPDPDKLPVKERLPERGGSKGRSIDLREEFPWTDEDEAAADRAWARVGAKEWNEEDHPRDEAGRFAPVVGDHPSGLPGDDFDQWAQREEELSINWPKEYESLNEYIQGSSDINNLLRQGKDADLRGSSRQEVREQIRDIDRLMRAQPPLKTDVVVYRRGDIGDVEVGDVIVDKGFVSTTMKEGELTPFHGRTMEITVPAGTRVLPGNAGEREVILPRGREYEVTDIEMKESSFGEYPARTHLRMKA